jgi:hypothetical protein
MNKYFQIRRLFCSSAADREAFQRTEDKMKLMAHKILTEKKFELVDLEFQTVNMKIENLEFQDRKESK